MISAVFLAAAITCADVRAIDGDTLDACGTRVRLVAIDTPERGKPGAQAAKHRLYTLTRGQVTCTPAGNQHDRYGRTVAQCFSNGMDIGAQMVREGYACVWRRYAGHSYVGIGRDCEGRGR